MFCIKKKNFAELGLEKELLLVTQINSYNAELITVTVYLTKKKMFCLTNNNTNRMFHIFEKGQLVTHLFIEYWVSEKFQSLIVGRGF